MLDFENLKSAYNTLCTCYNDYQKNQNSVLLEYIADSCVKRFEYTLETSWKFAKKILIQKYGKNDNELTMNNIFRFMQGYGYASNWENWRNYYQQRNNTSHEYNLEKSRELIKIIPEFIKDVEIFIDKLEEENNAD